MEIEGDGLAVGGGGEGPRRTSLQKALGNYMYGGAVGW